MRIREAQKHTDPQHCKKGNLKTTPAGAKIKRNTLREGLLCRTQTSRN
jgi:hypothetical protein